MTTTKDSSSGTTARIHHGEEDDDEDEDGRPFSEKCTDRPAETVDREVSVPAGRRVGDEEGEAEGESERRGLESERERRSRGSWYL